MIGSVLYTAYDLNTGQTCPALDVTLVCGGGNEFSLRYPLTEQERAALLEKMDPTAWNRPAWRWRISGPGIWRRHSSPARPPAWPSCEHAVGPVWALCAGFRRRAGQGSARPKNRPVGAGSAPGWGVRFLY